MLRRKYSAKAQVLKTSVPYGSTKVEYLESSGTQFIDSGFVTQNAHAIWECKFSLENSTSDRTYYPLFSYANARYDRDNRRNYGMEVINEKCNFLLCNEKWLRTNNNYSIQTVYDVTIEDGYYGGSKSNIIIDGSLFSFIHNPNIDYPYSENELPLVLFGQRTYYPDGIIYSSILSWKVYKMKYTYDDKLVINYLPCLDKTGTPCMFDLVSRKNFYNAGTGQFEYRLHNIFPSIVPSNYTKVDYLESSGTQWIDTLNYLNDNVEVQTELQYTNFLYNDSVQVNWFYGNYSLATKYVLWGLFNDSSNRGWAIKGNLSTGFNIPSNCTLFDRFIVEHTKDFIKLNGVACKFWDTQTLGELEAPKTLYLFARHHPEGYAQKPVSGKMWYFRVLYDGIVSHNYVPCLDPTGTPCMYDTITQTTYYNAGTGDFLYPSPTSSTTYSMRRPSAEYAKMTNTGVRRLYHVPVDYEGSIEEYASENGFKLLNETESPIEEGKYYAFRWVETDTEITTEWYETEPPTDEFGQVIENNIEQQSTTFNLRRPAPIDNTVYSNDAQWAKITDTGVHKIYHTPIGYEGSLEEYAIENGYKRLIETESPNEEGKYYAFRWVETDDALTTEWFEVEPPQEIIP